MTERRVMSAEEIAEMFAVAENADILRDVHSVSTPSRMQVFRNTIHNSGAVDTIGFNQMLEETLDKHRQMIIHAILFGFGMKRSTNPPRPYSFTGWIQRIGREFRSSDRIRIEYYDLRWFYIRGPAHANIDVISQFRWKRML